MGTVTRIHPDISKITRNIAVSIQELDRDKRKVVDTLISAQKPLHHSPIVRGHVGYSRVKLNSALSALCASGWVSLRYKEIKGGDQIVRYVINSEILDAVLEQREQVEAIFAK